ncbi:hypothetical protein BRADI_1g27856v3 [Brachypodium distachyon]|uniref:Uncharacterized protein n=1 Tax=Brachypodium distachyon TaxID=15368 RepID=A0A2K2DLG8_BRADI|nr:hypothetical protein BRADI_1g27856v3 [Brachypodium distachyon]
MQHGVCSPIGPSRPSESTTAGRTATYPHFPGQRIQRQVWYSFLAAALALESMVKSHRLVIGQRVGQSATTKLKVRLEFR